MPLLDDAGCPVRFAERLGRGGEGEVHAITGQPTLVAKVFDPARRAGKPDKLAAMLAAPPAGVHDLVEGFPVLTWPRGLLRDLRGDIHGYTMVRVRPEGFVPWSQVTSATRRQGLNGSALTWDKLVLLGLRLSHVVRALHRFGYAVGDLNDRNVLVSRRLTPLLMDTDSFQVPARGGHHPCTVGDALYWPPELLDVDLARRPVDREGSDRYALGVLLFQLFLAGMRPYQSRGSAVAGLDSLEAKTRAGQYPWSRPRPGVLEPPAGAPDYAALPQPIRAAFERCFVDGHHKPGKRPSAQDWVEVLTHVREAGYHACPRESRHVFGRGERRCPWCADPSDPFTPRKAVVKAPRVELRRQARPVRKGRRLNGPPQMQLGATPHPPTPPNAPRSQRPSARSARSAVRPAKTWVKPATTPKHKAAAKARGKTRSRRRARAAWPAKARWMTALTAALLAAWWMTS